MNIQSIRKLTNPIATRTWISTTFLRELLTTPRGRAYFFTQAAVAEETDEGAIFDRLEKAVADPQLQKAIAKHKADESRHAELYWDCVRRQGANPIELPKHLHLLETLREEIGTFDADIRDNNDVLRVYTVLQVIEERAVEQFRMALAALPEDCTTERTIVESVVDDEMRHLQYCQAAIARVAPSPAAAAAELAYYRRLEARAFSLQQQRSLKFLFDMDMLRRPQRFGWRMALHVVNALRGDQLPFTSAAVS